MPPRSMMLVVVLWVALAALSTSSVVAAGMASVATEGELSSLQTQYLRGHGSSSTSSTTGKKKKKNGKADLSVQFPTMAETLEMAKLSDLVYRFKEEDDSYCASFSNAQGIQCHWYFHDETLGTQVMIASNPHKRYLAVVFAGTDDLRTSLEDMDIAKKPFGNNSTVQLDDPLIKVHAGFNNAVFSSSSPDGGGAVFDQVSKRLKHLQLRHPTYKKVYTTGHSLGAANSILTATALAHQEGQSVVSINFGCPRTGNSEWREYLNRTSPLNPRLGIWKVVLGWDLVPRLPEFFDHVGHTIQLWSEDHEKYDKRSPNLVECYYRHCKCFVVVGVCPCMGSNWLDTTS